MPSTRVACHGQHANAPRLLARGYFYTIFSYNSDMSNRNHIATITELAQSEGGVFTAAQAQRLGVTLNALSHSVRAGRIERIVRGAYRLVGVPPSQTDIAVAFWKLTEPATFSHERAACWDGIAVGGRTAAYVLGIGDMHPYPCRIMTPARRRSKLDGVEFAVRAVAPEDVTWRAGMQVTRAERAILDMVLDHEDPSLVANALADATRTGAGSFDFARLEELFASSTGRWGVPKGSLDGLLANVQAPH